MTDGELRQGIEGLYEAYAGDEAAKRRIDADLAAMVDYIEVRERHLELSHAPAGEYDRQAVAAADLTRTAAHDEAIRASFDLNDLCAGAGLEPVAPAPVEGTDPLGSHRHWVADFAYQVIRNP